MNTLKEIAVVAFFLALLAVPITCARWEYGECKKVGHSTLYCLYKMGSKP